MLILRKHSVYTGGYRYFSDLMTSTECRKTNGGSKEAVFHSASLELLFSFLRSVDVTKSEKYLTYFNFCFRLYLNIVLIEKNYNWETRLNKTVYNRFSATLKEDSSVKSDAGKGGFYSSGSISLTVHPVKFGLEW